VCRAPYHELLCAFISTTYTHNLAQCTNTHTPTHNLPHSRLFPAPELTRCNPLQPTATHSNTLQHTATHCKTLQHTARQCNTLQHTATHCNPLQATASHCKPLQSTASHCIPLHSLQPTACHCNPPQPDATRCNPLQDTADSKTQQKVARHSISRTVIASPASRTAIPFISVLQRVAAYCSVLQCMAVCVAACCSVWHSNAPFSHHRQAPLPKELLGPNPVDFHPPLQIAPDHDCRGQLLRKRPQETVAACCSELSE